VQCRLSAISLGNLELPNFHQGKYEEEEKSERNLERKARIYTSHGWSVLAADAFGL
jgi:hypothetical protein